MRWVLLITWMGVLGTTAGAMAQTENVEPGGNAPAVVVITQPPTTILEGLDRNPGLTVRRLTKVGDVSDDENGNLAVYAVEIEDRTSKQSARGLSLVVTQRIGQASQSARTYVDADEIGPLIEGVKALAALDRDSSATTLARGVYRTKGNATISNIDGSAGRIALVRTIQISPTTGEVTRSLASYRSTRLAEIIRQFQLAKDALDKMPKKNE